MVQVTIVPAELLAGPLLKENLSKILMVHPIRGVPIPAVAEFPAQ
jgi:hypothetical protein